MQGWDCTCDGIVGDQEGLRGHGELCLLFRHCWPPVVTGERLLSQRGCRSTAVTVANQISLEAELVGGLWPLGLEACLNQAGNVLGASKPIARAIGPSVLLALYTQQSRHQSLSILSARAPPRHPGVPHSWCSDNVEIPSPAWSLPHRRLKSETQDVFPSAQAESERSKGLKIVLNMPPKLLLAAALLHLAIFAKVASGLGGFGLGAATSGAQNVSGIYSGESWPPAWLAPSRSSTSFAPLPGRQATGRRPPGGSRDRCSAADAAASPSPYAAPPLRGPES